MWDLVVRQGPLLIPQPGRARVSMEMIPSAVGAAPPLLPNLVSPYPVLALVSPIKSNQGLTNPLIWTALKYSRPSGTRFRGGRSHADPKGRTLQNVRVLTQALLCNEFGF